MRAERHRFHATSIGRAARAGLTDAARGHVLAVFRRSFYIETVGGTLACLGPPMIGRGPLNVVCDLSPAVEWEAGELRVGAPVQVVEGELTVAGRFSIFLSRAGEWRPPPLPPEWTPRLLKTGLGALAHAAQDFDPNQGLAGLVGLTPQGDGALLQAARPSVDALTRWLQGARARPDAAPTPDDVAARLIGLGPGLTPSGDDFIGGAMIALYACDHDALARRLADWALPLATTRTGSISLAHLACAAGGEGAEALHAIIAAIVVGDDSAIRLGLVKIDAIGHSSGWDALAGARVAMAAVIDSRDA